VTNNCGRNPFKLSGCFREAPTNAVVCAEDITCDEAVTCVNSTQCAAGQVCIDACCPTPVCSALLSSSYSQPFPPLPSPPPPDVAASGAPSDPAYAADDVAASDPNVTPVVQVSISQSLISVPPLRLQRIESKTFLEGGKVCMMSAGGKRCRTIR
jgi:hypothetical protein